VTAGYLAWLRRAKRLDLEKARKVRYFPPADPLTGEVPMPAVPTTAAADRPLARSAL
jgi:hypothetical protein